MENLPGAEPKNCPWPRCHTLASFSVFFSLLFHPSLHHSSPAFPQCCDAASKKPQTWLITSDREPAAQKTEEAEGMGSLVAIVFHLRPWASRWGCEPLAMEVPPCSQASQPASQPVCFLLWASFISLLHKAETWFSSFPPIFFAKLVSELAPNSTFNLIYSQINSSFLTWDTHISRTATNFSSRDWAAEFLIDILKTHGNCTCWKPTNYNLVSNLKFCQTPIGVFTCI